MLVMSGSEDGRVCAWDLNTQDLVIEKKIENAQLVSTIDYDTRLNVIAASGKFKGFYLSTL